jgi:hypothetical protein
MSAGDLWSRIEGVQHSPDGRPVKTVFKDGIFRPQAALSSLEALAIPVTNGQISERDFLHLRARLITKVRAKSLSLSDQQIVAEVDSLLNQLRSSPDKELWNRTIGEGFRSSPLDSRVMVTRETRPWETDWCLAKIVFELSSTVIAKAYQAYFREVIAVVQSFLESRECSPDGKRGTGIFTFSQLAADKATKCHSIEGRVDAHLFEWHLTFFGTARWSYRVEVQPIRAPVGGQIIEINNPTDGGDAAICVREIC